MTPFTIVLLFAVISSTSAAGGIFKIEGIEKPIRIVEFDSDSNTYAVYREYYNDLDGAILSLRTTKQNDVYVVLVYSDMKTGKLNLIRSGSSTLELLDSTGYRDPHLFIDSEDNLFYIASNNSAKIIRPNEFTPKTIVGGEDFQIYDSGKPLTFEGKDGNIYIGGCVNGNQDCFSGTQETRILLVTAEEKRKENPKAQNLENILQDSTNEYVTQITQTNNGDILIATFHFGTFVGTLQKLDQDKNATVLLAELGLHYVDVVKDRVIFRTAFGSIFDSCKFSILTSDYQWMEIKNLQNVTDYCLDTFLESDQGGNVFMVSGRGKIDTSYVEYLKYGELETIGVNFTDRIDSIWSMTLDSYGYLWMLDVWGNLFFVNRIGLVGERIFDSEGLDLETLFLNKIKNWIFAASLNGLYEIVPPY